MTSMFMEIFLSISGNLAGLPDSLSYVFTCHCTKKNAPDSLISRRNVKSFNLMSFIITLFSLPRRPVAVRENASMHTHMY
jgi:hypothetical protein